MDADIVMAQNIAYAGMKSGQEIGRQEAQAEIKRLRDQVETRDADLRKMDAYNAQLKAEVAELRAALQAIAGVLEAPRDRLGRLDIAATQGEAREELRLLAVKYNATGGTDYMHQCANVARAALASATGAA